MGQFVPDGFGQAVIHLEFTAGPSNPCAIVIGYDYLGQSAAVACGLINARWATFISGGSNWTNNLLLTGVTVLQNPGGLTAATAQTANGADGNPANPPNVAVLIRKNTATGGRRGRGRMYMPGVAQVAQLEGGFLTTAFQAAAQAGANTLLSGMATDDTPMVVLHDTLAGGIPAGVTSLTVQTILATQRRRIRS